ncbi:GyrI-like domain-containing protein [Actinoplanes sp. NPDC049599]|uniref:GyrI-like domain-containing protein n=1 Tax=Actinoplanes sp. NPDC049599 TaxID=3363903 RepID=UPI0037BD2813
MTYHIESRILTSQPTAVIRDSLPAARLPAWFPGVYEEILRHLTAVGAAPAGPPFARYTFHDDLVDVEAGFPVTGPAPGTGRVTSSSLPAGPAAVTTHHGSYEDLALAHDAVTDWLKLQGLEAAGTHWEIYYTNPAELPDPAAWRTDLVMPYRAR